MTHTGPAPGPGDDPMAGSSPSPSLPGAQPDVASRQPETPLVAWEAPAPQVPVLASSAGGYGAPAAFTVGALLSDTFARYGADFLRLFLVSAAASALSLLGSFAAPMGSSPFGRPTGFVDVGGLLGLASFIVGLVGSSTTFALAEGGRSVAFGRALRRGIERAGWLFLTSLILGVTFIAAFVVALIPIGLFFLLSPILAAVPFLILFVIFVWLGVRLSLALPANVADNLNSIEALKLSWRITKPSAVWARLIGAALLLGLLVLPAAIGALVLVFPAMFSGGAQLAFRVVPAVAFALFTPLSALLSFSAYRRLVPPLQPSWTSTPSGLLPPAATGASPMGIDAPAPMAPAPEMARPPEMPTAPDATAAAPTLRVPPFGTAAKAILALILAFDVAGLLAIPYGIGELARFAREGFPGLPGMPGSPGLPTFPGGDGEVLPGQVLFGADADLSTCTVGSPTFIATASTSVGWIAAPDRPVTPQDEVFVRVTRNGQELETTLQDPGAYDCIGSEAGVSGLVEGIYTYEVLVNGSVSATGSLFVQ